MIVTRQGNMLEKYVGTGMVRAPPLQIWTHNEFFSLEDPLVVRICCLLTRKKSRCC